MALYLHGYDNVAMYDGSWAEWRLDDDNPKDDLDALKNISHVAAASFAPFITAAHSSLLGLDSFQELERPVDLQAVVRQPEFEKWRRLRASEESRFVGLALPQILMRLPYEGPSSTSRAEATG